MTTLKQRLPHIAFISFLVLVCLYSLHIGVLPFVNPDTTQYVNGSAFRAPVYPAFLHMDMLLTGNSHFYFVFIIQLLLGVISSYYAGNTLKKLLDQPHWMGYLFTALFLIPYFFGDYKFANRLLSEGLCYPLYLIGFSQLLLGLVEKKIKPLLIFSATLYLMVLTRPQLMFLYPISFFAWLYVTIHFNISRLAKCLLLTGLILVIGSTMITDRLYHYIKHGHFASEPALGISLAIAPLYLSQPSDAALFHSTHQKELFTKLYEQLSQRKTNINFYSQSHSENIYYNFAGSFNIITWDIIYQTFKNNHQSNWYHINSQLLSMDFILLKAHWKKYISLWFFAVKEKMGGYYWLLFYLLLLGFCILKTFTSNHNKIPTLITFILLASFANYCSTALVEVIIRRYSSYTESFQLCLMLGLIFLILSHTSKIRALTKPYKHLPT